jgi:hypothetical protein
VFVRLDGGARGDRAVAGGELQLWRRHGGRRDGHRGVRRQESELQGLRDGVALEERVLARWPLQAATRRV